MASMSKKGLSVDEIGLSNPPSGEARKEKLMSPNAVERPYVNETNDNKQFIGKSGKPSGDLGQRGRM